MEGSPGSSLILILILVVINAFFASAEMAIVSLNKTKINILAEEGNKKAILLKNVLKDPNKFLSTIQVGITFAGFFASASAATSLSYGFANFLKSFNIPYSESIALVLTIIGAINWGLIGFFEFDLVAYLFGGQTAIISRVIYGLVGIAGLINIALLFSSRND